VIPMAFLVSGEKKEQYIQSTNSPNSHRPGGRGGGGAVGESIAKVRDLGLCIKWLFWSQGKRRSSTYSPQTPQTATGLEGGRGGERGGEHYQGEGGAVHQAPLMLGSMSRQ